MRLLLDTSAVVHLAAGSLSQTASAALRTGGPAFLSPVVPWELAILSPDRTIARYPVATVW